MANYHEVVEAAKDLADAAEETLSIMVETNAAMDEETGEAYSDFLDLSSAVDNFKKTLAALESC